MDQSLKLIWEGADIDFLIIYFTDIQVIWRKYSDWLSDNVYGKTGVFAAEIFDASNGILKSDARESVEISQSVGAAEIKNLMVEKGAVHGQRIRRLGNFVASELKIECTPESIALAQKIKIACAIGKRINLKRQSGVQNLLLLQQAGLEHLAPELQKWPLFSELLSDIDKHLGAIAKAAKDHAKEQIEADLAAYELERVVDTAIKTFNCAIRMVNVDPKNVPKDLLDGLRKTQNSHYRCFRRKKKKQSPSSP